jgi:hypothetical protein
MTEKTDRCRKPGGGEMKAVYEPRERTREEEGGGERAVRRGLEEWREEGERRVRE